MTDFAHLVQSAHSHATNNRAELNASSVAGCFYCLETYSPSHIDRYLNEGEGTACCPECSIDSVIGDASGLPVSEPAFLNAMHKAWFQKEPASPSAFEGTSDLHALGLRVRQDLDAYEIPAHHPEALGSPLPREWFERGLAEMRAALVEPYLAEVQDFNAAQGGAFTRQVPIVADDGDIMLLAFDPRPDNDFALVGREGDLLKIYNIRGDAVGCFLSR